MGNFNETPQSQSMFETNKLDQPDKPNNYLVLAIISTVLGLCSCMGLIIGIVAIIFATQVDSKYKLGDYPGAFSSSQNAKIFSIIAIVFDAIAIIISISYMIFMGSTIWSAFSNLNQ